MRTVPPAVQLRSVAARYQGSAARRPASGTRWRRLPAPPAAATPLEAENQRLRRLEAVLWIAREPQNVRKLAVLANLADGTEARTLIRRLNEHYDQVGRAFRVEPVAGGWQLLTRPQFATWLRRSQEHLGEVRLSAPALETLAVIAYRQPVPRADVEAIRGVHCGEVIRQLLERGLIRISGRGDELGRPYLYSTTKSFLQLFGLSALEDLPRYDSLQAPLLTATQDVHENSSNDPNPMENEHSSSSPSSPELKEPAVKVTTISGRAAADPLELESPALASAALLAAEGPRAGDDFDDEDEEEFDDEEDEDYDDDDYEDDEEDDDEDYEDGDEFDEEDGEEYEDEDEEEDEEYEDDEFDDEEDEWEEVEDDEEFDDEELDDEEDEFDDDEEDDWEEEEDEDDDWD